jgi:hypothetical protein
LPGALEWEPWNALIATCGPEGTALHLAATRGIETAFGEMNRDRGITPSAVQRCPRSINCDQATGLALANAAMDARFAGPVINNRRCEGVLA